MARYRSRLCRWVALSTLLATCWLKYRARDASFFNEDIILPEDRSFGLQGSLARILYDFYDTIDRSPLRAVPFYMSTKRRTAERLALSLFPFLQHPSNPQDPNPLKSLRSTFKPGSKGIVIPVGKRQVRFVRHLIVALRDIHSVTLPIAIAYAGDNDLPPKQRQRLTELRPAVELLDITTVLSDAFMDLRDGSWASKPFAALASPFEQVILLDSDVVFVNSPDLLFSQSGYKETGVLFFHERSFEPRPGNERQKFLEEQVKEADVSDSCCESMIKYSVHDNQDSGVVVFNKGRLQVLMGLLHACWQNSAPIRDKTTYKSFYDDKETYWLGMALTGAPFAFELEWGGIVGVLTERENGKYVCGNYISHHDENGELLWYNGSLLKDKAVDHETYMVPEYQMRGGKCRRLARDDPEFVGFSVCCHGGVISKLNTSDRNTIQTSVTVALQMDRTLSFYPYAIKRAR